MATEENTSTTRTIDIIEQDVMAIRANLKAAFAWLETHRHYGQTDTDDGEMLSDIGTVLLDSSNRLEGIRDKLDSYNMASMIETHGRGAAA